MIGLGLVFGLLNIVLLLGYGLVEIPKKCYKNSSNERKLRYYQYKVSYYQGQLQNKTDKVQEFIFVRPIISNLYVDS